MYYSKQIRPVSRSLMSWEGKGRRVGGGGGVVNKGDYESRAMFCYEG